MMTDVFIVLFGVLALVFAGMVLLARQPMRAALALVAHMTSLAAIYACLDVHVVALFQVLIYVGAVMVFMVYTIMLLDDRDVAYRVRFSGTLVPGVAGRRRRRAGAAARARLKLGTRYRLPRHGPGADSRSRRSRSRSWSGTGCTSSSPPCCCWSASSRRGP